MNHIVNVRRVKNFALTAVLGFALVGLSQCRMVEDNITGVDLNVGSTVDQRSDCVKDCNERYKDAKRIEDDRHKAAEKACRSDKACKKAEKDRNKNNEEAIKDAKDACKRGCYNEGSGGGGR